METAPLKSFAISSRIELIREISARITAVLAQGSPERVEQPRIVTALERAIAGAGGGDKGKAHVADKVAYTWFNRIIALRFMDANGYTGIGVVSPAADQLGQPEVLASAKRGQVDTTVVKGPNAATVRALLNGTRQPRPGIDPQAEAYELLLADYCRYWNRAMPFMFEREGDYAELLIPANLLAGDSALSRSVRVLTQNVCQDVEVIGWLYQFYISERKQEVFDGFKAKGAARQLAGADEIPAATQLFTPHWIVRYLVENSLGRLWMLNHPQSRLIDQMDYYIAPVDEETEFPKITKPEELTVIDPACGSGHMLTYAFDLLYAIYEEEGYTPSQIPGMIITNNLYGTEIDPRAGALAAFALTMKAAAKRKLFLKNPVEPNVCVLDPISFSVDELEYLVTKDGDRYEEKAFWNQFTDADTFGSLIQPDPDLTARLAGHLATLDDKGDILRADAIAWAGQVVRQAKFLSVGYSVVVANPPYMGGTNMGGVLAEFAKRLFPTSRSDLFAMFIERCIALAQPRGLVGMVTMQAWMFISSFATLRARIIASEPPVSMVHMGERAFDSIGGAVVSTTAFVLELGGNPSANRLYIRVVDGENERAKQSLLLEAIRDGSNRNRHRASASQFLDIDGSPVAYWLSGPMREAFAGGTRLSTITEPRQGMATADNNRFVRQWWEVSYARIALDCLTRDAAKISGAKWFPYNKAGGSRKWWGHQECVVNWANDGQEIRNLGTEDGGRPRSRVQNVDWFFRSSVSWSRISTDQPSFRVYPEGFIFDVAGGSIFPQDEMLRKKLIGLLNSSFAERALNAIAPTINFTEGNIGAIPVLQIPDGALEAVVDQMVEASREDWDDFEVSWGFLSPSILHVAGPTLESSFSTWFSNNEQTAHFQHRLENENNRLFADVYRLTDEVGTNVPLHQVSLSRNVEYIDGPGRSGSEYRVLAAARLATELVSYSVGCMLGRYSLDEPGLILADQGATLQDYLAKVPTPRFTPDADNVIPIVDGDWFEDDIVGRFRQFLRAAFGQQHFEENLRYVTESLGVKNLRDYFVKSFYKDHVQRYKKRPIYWLFSSPKGSFNALIYMHRYTPSTVSTVLTYLREYVTKLESALQQAQLAGDAKEADRLRKILGELKDYERDTLFPIASENVVIDLDDGVKTNYSKFGAALKKVVGLEAADD